MSLNVLRLTFLSTNLFFRTGLDRTVSSTRSFDFDANGVLLENKSVKTVSAIINAGKKEMEECTNRARGDSVYFQGGLENVVAADGEDKDAEELFCLGVGISPSGMLAFEAESMFRAVEPDILLVVITGNCKNACMFWHL